ATACGDDAERERLTGAGSPSDERLLPPGAAGSCHRKRRGRIARYAFGATWDVAPPSTDPGAPIGTLREVKPGSPAARAGLAVGDALLHAAYVPGRPDVEAKLTVRRAGKDLSIT